MGEGRRGEPEVSPLSSPAEAGEVVGVDLAPVATRSRGTGRGGSDRWGGGRSACWASWLGWAEAQVVQGFLFLPSTSLFLFFNYQRRKKFIWGP